MISNIEVYDNKIIFRKHSINNYLVEKKIEDKYKENINNHLQQIEIKSKKIKKNKSNFLEEKKLNVKETIKKRNITNKNYFLWIDEIQNTCLNLNLFDLEEFNLSENKFSSLKTLSPNILWFLINLFYFNNNLCFKKEDIAKYFYENTNLNGFNCNYQLVNQILNNFELMNSNSFLKNHLQIKKNIKFNLIEDLKYLSHIKEIKKNAISKNNIKGIKLNTIIKGLLNKIKKIKNKVKNSFYKLEVENKLSFERESKFLSYYHKENQEENILNLVNEERIYIDFLDSKSTINFEYDLNNIIKEKYYCHACNNADINSKNELIFCSFCNISIHIKCYTLFEIPKMDYWICQVCLEFGKSGKFLPCALCTKKGGVLKKTSLKTDNDFFIKKNPQYHKYLLDCRENFEKKNYNSINKEIEKKIKFNKTNKNELFYEYINENDKIASNENNIYSKYIWVHLSCSFWTPQMYITAKNTNEILGMYNIDKKRFNHFCIICNQYNGACVKCNNKYCKKYFHIECARRINYHLEVFNYGGKKLKIYCHEHKPFYLKRNINFKEKKTREDMEKFGQNIIKYIKEKKLNKFKKSKINNNSDLKKEKKIEIEELVDNLNNDQIYFLNKIKNYIFNNSKNCFKIKIKNNKIKEIIKPKKNFLSEPIEKNNEIFRKYIKDYNLKLNNTYNFYSKIVSELKSIQNNNNIEIKNTINNFDFWNKSKDEDEEEEKEEDLNNNFNELGEYHCICNKPWDGEIMIECERCKLWFHPKCQNLNLKNQNIENINFICLDCTGKMIIE